MDFLFEIDKAVFYFFNHTLSSMALDRLFATITDVNSWYITYIVLIGIMIAYGGKRGRIAAVMVILLVTVCDQTGARLLKELVERVRPCNFLPDALTPIGPEGTWSFPSNHALNNFAVAMFFTILYPKLKWVLFITATLIAISRVYLGLHYPSDILGGAIIGAAIGYAFAKLQLYLEEKIPRRTSEPQNPGTSET